MSRGEELRAALTRALESSCSCGTCPSDELLRELLQLSDDELEEVLR